MKRTRRRIFWDQDQHFHCKAYILLTCIVRDHTPNFLWIIRLQIHPLENKRANSFLVFSQLKIKTIQSGLTMASPIDLRQVSTDETASFFGSKLLQSEPFRSPSQRRIDIIPSFPNNTFTILLFESRKFGQKTSTYDTAHPSAFFQISTVNLMVEMKVECPTPLRSLVAP